MEQAINPFVSADAAARYAQSRPNYHPQAIATALSVLGQETFSMGLDLGCGTGMSTAALAEATDFVVGLDPSFQMLRQARKEIPFVQAAAEQLPIRSRSCDVVTAGAAFHWFDQAVALGEIRRVLSPGGVLVVYTDWFTGRLREAPELERWMERYVADYPSPRRRPPFDEDLVTGLGFEIVGEKDFAVEFSMDAEGFSEYLLTQSNALHAIEQRRTTASDLKRVILDSTQQWFPGSAMFEGDVWCARVRSR